MTYLLSDEKEEEYHTAFQMIDKDGSGSISWEELGALLRGFGQTITDDELKSIITEHDADNSGQLEFEEFKVILQEVLRQEQEDNMHQSEEERARSQEERIQCAFNMVDLDNNGTITSDEMRVLMSKLGDNLTDDQIEEMMTEADTDGDGEINFEEFSKLWKELESS